MKHFRFSGSRTMRTVVSCIVALVMMIPALGTVAAQSGTESGLVSDTEYDFLTGNVLTWDDPWTVLEDQTGFDSGLQGDYVVLLDDEASRLEYYSQPSIGSVRSNLDFIASAIGYSYESGELLEHEADKEQGHSVLRFSSGSFSYFAYIDIQSTEDLSTLLTTILLGPDDDIVNIIESVQDSVELDGEPLLDAVDPDEVQDLVDDGVALDFPIDRNQFDLPDDDTGDNEDVKLPDDEDADPTPDSDDISDPEDLGLIEAGVYESPQYGNEVIWDIDGWEADTSLLISDEDLGVDRFALDNLDGDATLYLSFYDGDDVSPEEWAASFVETSGSADSDITILNQDSDEGIATFYYRLDGDDASQFGVIEARTASGGVTVVVELLGAKEDVRDVFRNAQDEVTVDDDDLFQEFRRFPRITSSDEG